MTNEEGLKAISDLETKYCDLVWYARRRPENMDIKGVRENTERIEKLYPIEVQEFMEGDNPDWEHGFNSGMLAGMRYILDMVDMGKNFADEAFPFLDT